MRLKLMICAALLCLTALCACGEKGSEAARDGNDASPPAESDGGMADSETAAGTDEAADAAKKDGIFYKYLPGGEEKMFDSIYFPKPKQPEMLYVIDKSGLSNYERILLASMQGVTAKNRPCIWISGCGESYDLWLSEIKNDFGMSTKTVDSVYTLLETVAGQIDGYILFDLTDGTSLNVATSLAGIKRAVMADVHIEDKMRELGLTCLFDARGLGDDWTYENCADKFGQGEELLNDKIMLEQRALENDERYYTLRDYAIFCNMATVYQSTSGLMDKFLQKMRDDSVILGWGDGDKYGEDNLGIICAKNGVNRVASDWASNLTVLSAFYPDGEFKQKTATDPNALVTENVHYATFIWTDGDNIQWTTGDFAKNPIFWDSPSRGKFNMGWGINNLLYELAPTTMQYYYETASVNENAKDYFVVGPHYTYAKYFYPTLPSYTAHLNELMGKTGLKYVQINELMTLREKKSAFDDYTEHENIHGLFYLEYSKYDAWGGKLVWSNGKPVVTARYAIWDPKQMKNASPDDVLDKLNSAAADPTSPDGYSFITVHAWSGYDMEDLQNMISKLDSRVKVVTPDEFMLQIIKNIPHDE